MADQEQCEDMKPHERHGWVEAAPGAPLGWHFHVCAGVDEEGQVER